MSIGFPTNTVAMIMVTLFGVGASTWFILSQAIKRVALPPAIQRNWRWGISAVLVLWLLACLAPALFPPHGGFNQNQIFTIVASNTVGLLVGILALLVSPAFRQIVRAVPQTWLIGVHAIRLEGFLFVALVDMHLLPTAFGLSAGYGDMVAGLLALGVVYLLSQIIPGTQTPAAARVRAFAIAWNIYGLLDFINALISGPIFIGPFARQAAAFGVPLNYLNFVLLIPAFAVPVLALLHFFSLYQILSAPLGQPKQGERYDQVRAPAR